MKTLKLIILAIVATSSFAVGQCRTLYESMVDAIPTQKVKFCNIESIPDGNNNNQAMFFQLNNETAVLLYRSDNADFRELLVNERDTYYKKAIKCKQTKYEASYSKMMTTDDIIEKLLSFKRCEKDFKIKR